MATLKNNTYSSIFKSTFLFGFVQVFNIIAKVGINKAVAYFLGPEGMGIISLYQSVINILKSFFELGLSQSAVREISQSSQSDFSKTISVTKRFVLLTSSIGFLATIILSPWLSRWTFDGSSDYTYAFMWLSIVVFLNIITEGQLGILKGVRELRALAKASLLGSIVGLFVGVPLYYFFREKGIIPSLIVSSLAALSFSSYFVTKIQYTKISLSHKAVLLEGQTMLKMGVAFMYVTFLGFASDYFIRIYISEFSSLKIVGLYQAGATIVTAYFGIVITALTTDYYPRISAINRDNKAVEVEFNKQTEVGLIMLTPLVVIFMFAQDFFVSFLYTKDFLSVVDFLQYATFGVLLLVCSNSLGIILLAKKATNIFFVTATIGRLVIVGTSILFFHFYGIKGLGISYSLTSLFHLIFMQSVLWYKFNIKMHIGLVKMLFFSLAYALIAYFAKDFDNLFVRYFSGFILILCTLYYSLKKMKSVMGINIITIVKNKLHR